MRRCLESRELFQNSDAETIVARTESNPEGYREQARSPLICQAEDIHMFMEAELTKRIGDSWKASAYCKKPERSGGFG